MQLDTVTGVGWYTRYNLELRDTAKKLLVQLEDTATKLLQIYLHSSYRFLELLNIALNDIK